MCISCVIGISNYFDVEINLLYLCYMSGCVAIHVAIPPFVYITEAGE